MNSITISRVKAGLYNINLNGQRVGIINRFGRRWLTDIPSMNYNTDNIGVSTLKVAELYARHYIFSFIGEEVALP